MKVKIKVSENFETIEIDKARVSFPSLWEPGFYDGAKKAGLDTSFLVDAKENPEVVKQLRLAYLKTANAENPKVTKLDQLLNLKMKMSDDGGNLIIQTNNSLSYPPAYVSPLGEREMNPLAVGADKVLYGGCYAKVKLTLRAVTAKGKVKVWISLAAIQFAEKGERFGASMSEDELMDGFGKIDSAEFDTTETKAVEDSTDELGLDESSDGVGFSDEELEL